MTIDVDVQQVAACPLCGGVEFGDFREGLYRCAGCELVVSPAAWERGADTALQDEWFEGGVYDPSPSPWTARFERWNARRTWRRIAAAGTTSGQLLEVGVGSGALLAYMRERGFDVRGCDMSRALCDHVERHRRVPMHHGPLGSIAPGETFDVVVMNHVLEHVSDPVALLQDARRVLRPGGVLHIAVPNVASWEAALAGWTSYQPYHLVYFAPRTLRRCVESAGFAVTTQGSTEPFSGWTLTLLRTALGYRLGAERGGSVSAPAKRPALVEHTYRLVSLVAGAGSFPLRVLQASLGAGEELVVVARTPGPG